MRVAVALAVGLGLSAGFASLWYASVRRGQEQTFHQVTNRATDDIASSVTDVSIMQRGLQGLYAGSGEVTQDGFRTYLRSLSDGLPLAHRFPGLLGVLVAGEGPGGLRVELAEPPGAQGALVGRPLPAGSPLAEALVRSGDLDLALLVPAGDLGTADSAIVAPLGDGRRRWVVLLLDRSGLVTDSLRGSRVRLRLSEAEAGAAGSATLAADPEASDAVPSGLRRRMLVTVADRSWTLDYQSLEGFTSRWEERQHWVILAFGAVIALLLARLLWTQGMVNVFALRRVEEATALLHDREQRFRSLAASSPIGIFYAGPSGEVVYANRRLVDIAGVAELDVLGDGLWRLLHRQGDDEPLGALSALQPDGELSLRCWLPLPDGAVTWVHVRAAGVGDGTEARTGWAGTVEDITVQVTTQDELARRETAHRELARQSTHRALHDPLTGLANRVLLHDRLGVALTAAGERRGRVALLFLDLDRFKLVNDSFGHTLGDELLVAVADRVRGCLRDGDLPARLGGDEFAVLVPELGDPAGVDHLAVRLASVLSRPFGLGGQTVTASASIGIAVNGRGDERPEDLVRNADLAMYAAKSRGRGGHAWFVEPMHDAVVAKVELEADLREAVTSGSVTLAYQPVIDMLTGQAVGAEALARWHHPTRGDVAPDAFISLAEETGLIIELGRLLLRAACREASTWPQVAGPAPFVTVNVAAAQLVAGGFAEEVAAALTDAGLPASRLVLELTESAVMDHTDDILATLDTTRASGVRIAIDDFGTGHSSLAKLRSLPIDILKIDRAFVAGIEHRDRNLAFLKAILRLGEAFGLELVVEGVETEAQVRQLRRCGYRFAQGYHFAPAVRPADLPGLFQPSPAPVA